jgi:hypothetical protein
MTAAIARPRRTPASSNTLAAGSVLGVAYLGFLGVAMSRTAYDTWGGALMVPFCLSIGAPIVLRVLRNERAVIRHVALVGLLAKVLFSFVRYYTMRAAYEGTGDFERYHIAGVQLAAGYSGVLAPFHAWPTSQGTAFVEEFTGFVYTIIGPSRLGGFVVFSFIAYWGLFFFQRAVATAAPGLDQVRYAKLVFLWPSLLFWPSSIGKDALMIFALGLASLGAARLYAGRASGPVLFALGCWAAYAIRPHLTVLLLGALAGSFVFPAVRVRARGSVGVGPLPRLAAVALLLVGFSFAMGKTADFFGVDTSEGGSATDQLLALTERRTDVGGSAIGSSRPNSIAQYPNAVVSVLFRPFIFEARSVPMFISAGEATLLMGAFVVSAGRLARSLLAPQRTRFVAMALLFSIAFIFAFSSFSNLGLLARQRTQMLPFVLVLFAGPLAPRRRAARHERKAMVAE